MVWDIHELSTMPVGRLQSATHRYNENVVPRVPRRDDGAAGMTAARGGDRPVQAPAVFGGSTRLCKTNPPSRVVSPYRPVGWGTAARDGPAHAGVHNEPTASRHLVRTGGGPYPRMRVCKTNPNWSDR